MSSFVINGGNKLTGSLPVFGSKNAALPLLAASLLTDEEVQLNNIPGISDVDSLLEILSTLGVEVERSGDHIKIRATTIANSDVPNKLVRALRASVLLLGALLGRTRQANLPLPGGDIIGSRPIDVHLDAFRQLGAAIAVHDSGVRVDGSKMKAGNVTLQEFSVTATENVMLVAATLPGKTTVHIAAAEPHVEALGAMLNLMGARVRGAGTHTITIVGAAKLQGAQVTNIQDMLEAGTFILLAAATKSALTIEKVPLNHLRLFWKKLDDIGIDYEIGEPDNNSLAAIQVRPAPCRAFTIKTLPYPGLATDLQSPFAVMATQAAGHSLIHDPLYEGRFKYVSELQKMGADAVVCDPHRVIINGPTALHGQRIPGLDVRSGATLIIAGLVAEGQTIVDQADHIERGYANLPARLKAIGADIKLITNS